MNKTPDQTGDNPEADFADTFLRIFDEELEACPGTDPVLDGRELTYERIEERRLLEGPVNPEK